MKTKIVAIQVRPRPIYTFATAPGSSIASAADFRGRKIGFSQGQAQGVVVLRALKEAGLKNSDVELVALPSTQFLTALQSGQVDVAPLGEPTLTKYLDQYGKDGAIGLKTDVVDLLTVLWAPVEVLNDPARAAAVRSFVPLWAKGLVWAWENSDEWIDTYYVKDQGVSEADGRLHRLLPPPAAVPRQLGQGHRMGAGDRRPDGRGRVRAEAGRRRPLRPPLRGTGSRVRTRRVPGVVVTDEPVSAGVGDVVNDQSVPAAWGTT